LFTEIITFFEYVRKSKQTKGKNLWFPLSQAAINITGIQLTSCNLTSPLQATKAMERHALKPFNALSLRNCFNRNNDVEEIERACDTIGFIWIFDHPFVRTA